MSKPKIMCIFGTRPEAVKMAPVARALKKSAHGECIVCVSAQHRGLLDDALNAFNITPDIDLNIMKEHQTLTDITTACLTRLAETFREHKPALCLVHGDTTTAFAASLAAFYAGVKTGHVEAGLRTYDKRQPYPEEMNRLLISRLADLHFAPTVDSKNNLLKENIPQNDIYVTGNTAVDALFYTTKGDYTFFDKALSKIDYGKTVITLTAHRRENIGEGLDNICRAALKLTEKYKDITIVYPVHPNPAVKEPVYKTLAGNSRIILTNPLNITDMHNLMLRSRFILTDSGGIQEEAPSLGKPVLVLRDVTERPEGLAAGTLMLAGTKEPDIINAVSLLLEDEGLYNKMSNAKNPFGDGKAAERIVNATLYALGAAKARPLEFVY